MSNGHLEQPLAIDYPTGGFGDVSSQQEGPQQRVLVYRGALAAGE